MGYGLRIRKRQKWLSYHHGLGMIRRATCYKLGLMKYRLTVLNCWFFSLSKLEDCRCIKSCSKMRWLNFIIWTSESLNWHELDYYKIMSRRLNQMCIGLLAYAWNKKKALKIKTWPKHPTSKKDSLTKKMGYL